MIGLYSTNVELYNSNDLPSHSERLHEKFLCVSVSFRSAHFWIVPSVQFLFCMTIPWPQVLSIPVASHWVTLSHPEIIRSQSLRGLPASLHDIIRVKWPPWSFQLLSSNHSASSHLFSVPSVQLRICMMRPGPHPLCSSVGTHVSLFVQFPSSLGMGSIMNRNAIAKNYYCYVEKKSLQLILFNKELYHQLTSYYVFRRCGLSIRKNNCTCICALRREISCCILYYAEKQY